MYIICHFWNKNTQKKKKGEKINSFKTHPFHSSPLKNPSAKTPFRMAVGGFPRMAFFSSNPNPPRSDDEDPRIIALMTMRLVLERHPGPGIAGIGARSLPNGFP